MNEMNRFQRRVHEAFDQAGMFYDRHAVLQRQAMLKLLTLLPESSHQVPFWLDVGSGTGLVYEALAAQLPAIDVVCFDLAAGMLKVAGTKGSRLLVQGDMHRLPFADASLPVVISNFALQWTDHPKHLLAEFSRVLSDEGIVAFSVPVQGSLQALSKGWAAAGLVPPINELPSGKDWLDAVQKNALSVVQIWNDRLEYRDDDARQALALVRDLGAGTRKKPAMGLMSPRRWQKVLNAWSLLSEGRGYCIDYEVLWMVLAKKPPY